MTEYSYNVNQNSIEKNGKFIAYVDVIDVYRIVNLLNKQEKQLNPFINLAKDYNLTLNQLFDICSDCIDKLNSTYKQK